MDFESWVVDEDKTPLSIRVKRYLASWVEQLPWRMLPASKFADAGSVRHGKTPNLFFT